MKGAFPLMLAAILAVGVAAAEDVPMVSAKRLAMDVVVMESLMVSLLDARN